MTIFQFEDESALIASRASADPEKKDSPPRFVFRDTDGEKVEEAGLQLCTFIDPCHVLNDKSGPRHPLVILAFDEAHVLTNKPGDPPWNIFIELHRVLRTTVDQPIFSLFLTTAGRFQLSSPDIRSDPSSRVTNEDLCTLHPIPEISFDTLAHSAKEYMVSLQQVTETDWMARLGRPLCVDYAYTCESG
jgi:hypothetical protein